MEIKKQIELMFKEKQATVVLPTPPKINRTGANYFVCNFEGCGATIKHRRNLIRHFQLHQKAKYYCFNCGYQSMNREQITQHHCDPNTPKFDCDECDDHSNSIGRKEFGSLQHLNRHLLLIHGVRLFVWCPTCRSYFARIDALKKHQSRCHQTDSISTSLLSSASIRNESTRSITNIPAISTSTITSVSKNKSLLNNSSERIISSVISSQSQQPNSQIGGTSKRDENHFINNPISNKQTSIINLNSSALNNTTTSSNSNQISIDENFRSALINKAPILLDNSVGNAFSNNNFTFVRNSVISRGSATSNMMINMEEQLQNTLNDNANRIKLLNSNIMLSNNNKVQQFISTSVNNSNNDRDNPFDAIREDYLYRNKKIRFGELIDKDRVFKH